MARIPRSRPCNKRRDILSVIPRRATPTRLLRWKYGRKKEQKKASDRNKHPYSRFSTFNVIIDKSIFSKFRFYEELKQYGHEDTLFSYQLKKAGIAIYHIDNGLGS